MTEDGVLIPAVGDEELQWAPRLADMHSRREVARQTGSYRSAVLRPIVDWQPHIPPGLQADIEDASGALARFDEFAANRLGADGSGVGAMSSILLRSESASSSQIEQLTTSARQLARAEIDLPSKNNATTVLGNVRAMEAAVRLSSELTIDSILRMHQALMSRHRGFEGESGALRTQAVWIGPGSAGPLLADYVAPRHELVPGGMNDLVQFLRRDDLPVLVQVAVSHAQFETIHPFTDGNGRTGRALAHAVLRNKGLTTSAVIPISAGLLTHLDDYFAALSSFRGGDAGPIIRRFAEAARFATVAGRGLIDDLSAIRDSHAEKMSGVRSDSAAWRLLSLLPAQPVVNVEFVGTTLGVSMATALRALDTLVQRGILTESSGRQRYRVWQQTDILGVLDDYANVVRRQRH